MTHTLTWNLQGVSKGLVAQQLLSTMVERGRPPDFVLCIGDDRSDEDMFASIASAMAQPSMASIVEVFACTVGQKPSKAKYYLDDTVEVKCSFLLPVVEMLLKCFEIRRLCINSTPSWIV